MPDGMSGTAEWYIVPYSEAAPTSNRSYDVSGILSHDLDTEEIVIPLLPTKITAFQTFFSCTLFLGEIRYWR